MRFAWKVFLSAMLVSAAALSLCAYLLSDAAFDAALTQEKQKAIDRIRMLAVVVESMASDYSFASDEAELASVMRAAATGDFSSAALFLQDERAVYGRAEADAPMDELFAGAQTGVCHTILARNGRYFMHMLMPVQLGERTGYLYLVSDVSAPFSLSDEMARMANILTLAATAAAGIVLFIIARLLTRPVRSLSSITRAFAKGDFSKRAAMCTSDEIGELTRDFNFMADSLEAHMGELAAQARRREDFVASFAHELKTPLTSIIGYADTLRSRAFDEEERFRSANYIFTEGRRLERLSLKLLELMVLNRRDFPLRDLSTGDVRERLSATLEAPLREKYGVSLACDMQDAAIRSEADLLQTMLVNLCDNAAKASSAGQAVKVTGRRCPAGYRVEVTDEGVGMRAEELARVKEAFYMVDKSRSRARDGAGLGLALCDAIAKALGTELNLDSEPGQGTIAWLLLPYAKGEADAQ